MCLLWAEVGQQIGASCGPLGGLFNSSKALGMIGEGGQMAILSPSGSRGTAGKRDEANQLVQ